jgi:hypothetical protein
LSYKNIYLNLMSKPCLKASLFATPIFIYSEAGGIFLGWRGRLGVFSRS